MIGEQLFIMTFWTTLIFEISLFLENVFVVSVEHFGERHKIHINMFNWWSNLCFIWNT